MNFSEFLTNDSNKNTDAMMDNKTETKEIIINDILTYDSVKPIIEQILNKENNTLLIKCENISEIDITGVQFLLSVKKYSNKINIETNFTNETSKLLAKAGYKF